MIACLPMYDRAETRAANDRLWTLSYEALCAAGISAPKRLSRSGDCWEIWQNPDLLLAQTCGLPFRACLHGKVTLVATPVHDLEGCPPGTYCSVIVANHSAKKTDLRDFQGACLAYNDPLSQSGWAAPSALAQRANIRFGAFLETGSHWASAKAVADGAADLAAIDAVTWGMILRYDDFARRLTVVTRTDPTPALPYICARGIDPAAVRHALALAIEALPKEDARRLRLFGLTNVPEEDYLAQALPAPPPNQ